MPVHCSSHGSRALASAMKVNHAPHSLTHSSGLQLICRAPAARRGHRALLFIDIRLAKCGIVKRQVGAPGRTKVLDDVHQVRPLRRIAPASEDVVPGTPGRAASLRAAKLASQCQESAWRPCLARPSSRVGAVLQPEHLPTFAANRSLPLSVCSFRIIEMGKSAALCTFFVQ